MPALARPRHEAFAQALFKSLGRKDYSQGKAYQEAGYKASAESAIRCASRLLIFVEAISDRVRELQEQSARRKQVTVESIVDRLDLASRIAEEDRLPAALTQAETSKAKILGLQVDRQEVGKPGDFNTSQTTDELAQAMLAQAGASTITSDMKAMAIAELDRHSRVLASIAAGEPSSDLAPPSTSKRQSSQLSA